MNCKPTLKFSDEDVDMESYQEPSNFDLEKIAEALTDVMLFLLLLFIFFVTENYLIRETVSTY